MGRWCILLLPLLFVMQLVAGCAQQPSEKKPLKAKPEVRVEEAADETDIEEVEEVEESEESEKSAPGQPQKIALAPEPAEMLVVADFDSGDKISNLGTNFGAWNKDPSDPTQWCRETFDNATRYGDKGFSMKLDYSVDSPNPAYNGFWLMLPNLDAAKYDTLKLRVKGDPKTGYTTVFKIELKNANKQVGRYYITNLGDEWREISIPLSELRGLNDRSNLTEFVVVFEDRMASNKKGSLYIDDIKFIRNK